MSVLIKGMTMPKNCYECSFYESKYHCHGCHAVPKSFEDMDMWNFIGDDRPSWCPLVELPPHGDLIDRHALLEGEGRYVISLCKEGIDVEEILRAKTIIPASEGET